MKKKKLELSKSIILNHRMLIFVIIAIGFILRVVGLRWGGEDQLFYPDEYNVVNNIRGMVESGTLGHIHR